MKTAKDFILKHWNPEIIPGECEAKHFFDEMDRVMQLYSDHQNKELREKHEKQIADWKREEKMWGEHELHYKAEIQRLTKEVEGLKQEKEKWRIRFQGTTFFDADLAKMQSENTRLRELLGECRDFIGAEPYIQGSVADLLLTKINNALNKKP